MNDMLEAKIVEVTVDPKGKLWVNVDGVCFLRIGHCDMVVTDNHVYGHEEVDYTKE